MKSLKHMMIGAIACKAVAFTPPSQAQGLRENVKAASR